MPTGTDLTVWGRKPGMWVYFQRSRTKLHESWCTAGLGNQGKYSVWGLTLALTSFRGCKIKREFSEEVGELHRYSVQLGEAGQGTKTKDTVSWSEGSFQLSHQRLYNREQDHSLLFLQRLMPQRSQWCHRLTDFKQSWAVDSTRSLQIVSSL